MKQWIALIAAVMVTGAGAAAPKVITIIGTADLQGTMAPMTVKQDWDKDGKKEPHKIGGIARIATIMAQMKKENPHTVVVATGDDLMNRFFHTHKGKGIFTLMSMAGYELYALGNHEFDKGTKVLHEALQVAQFKVLCSDLEIKGSKLEGDCTPWTIREISGVKVGFFSLMTEELAQVTQPGKVTIKAPNVVTAERMIKLLRTKGATVIVALTHIGQKQDVGVAKQVKGIDLIFGGHSHHYMKKMGRIHKTAIVNGGEAGRYVVRVDLPIDAKGRVIAKQVTMTTISVDERVKEEPKIAAKVAAYIKAFPASIVLGKTEAPWDLRSDTIRKSESNVADLVNDLLRKQFKVDIVLNNSGAFRGKRVYPKGSLTDTMLNEIDEFKNNAFLFTIKGKWITEILEHSAAKYGQGGFMQVSGLKYRVDLKGQPQKIEDEKVVTVGSRVKEYAVEQNGKWVKVDPKKEYTILTNSFIVNHAGDGYYWFKKYGKEFKNTYTTFYSIMATYLDKNGVLTPKALDGRIVVEH